MFLKDGPAKIEDVALIGEVVRNEEAGQSGEVVSTEESGRRGS
jgi:hypothetical protein